MRRSGAPSQRSFSGLLNLPSPKTPANLGGCSPRVSELKTSIQPATHGLSSNSGGGMTSEAKDSGSSQSAPGQGPNVSLSISSQLPSPSTQPAHLRKPQSPALQNRSPLLQLNRPTAVLRHPSPADARLLGQNPNLVTVSMSTNPSGMRSGIYSNSEAKKPFPSTLTPAAAVDSTTNSTSFRCFHNLLISCDTLHQVFCMRLGEEIWSQAQEMGRRWAAACCNHHCPAH